MRRRKSRRRRAKRLFQIESANLPFALTSALRSTVSRLKPRAGRNRSERLRFQVTNGRTFPLFLRNSIAVLFLLIMTLPAEAQLFPRASRPDPGPKPKNVRGLVADMRGK